MEIATFTPSISPEIRAEIMGKLAGVEADNNVRILFAIESGSRAWGFPSPDSDYDVRFIYAHDPDWYLSIQPGRDVIELPIVGDWDINGWDIRKALGLLIKPNPVMLEWLSSPIRYMWDDTVCDRLIDFANQTTFGPSCLHHYRNLGDIQWLKHVGDAVEVSYKKYFYILRPALAIKWIRVNPTMSPPMNLQALVDGIDLERNLVTQIEMLLDLKSHAKEIGRGQRISEIDVFIREQLDWAKVVPKAEEKPDLLEEANELLREIVKPTLA